MNPSQSADNLDKFETLEAIIARLRSENGCPWDRAQSHASLKKYLLEETYEALDALDCNDPAKLREELGDLLLQIVLHAQIGRESKEFTMAEVISQINTKLVHRHPHVFGDVTVKSVQDVVHNWEELKKEEHKQSVLGGLPSSMPALAYSELMQGRAARTGFDWPNVEGVIEKLGEEIRELEQAPDAERKKNEFGDILFTLCNVARHMSIDAEESLRLANKRFERRFSHMEKLAAERGLVLNKLSMDELNRLWDEAKKATGAEP